ncbi:MAG: TatD DNase family protein [archaeon GW2011_AR3]|nr:MAG: TatD DNase family protein [archaeon GW2011_AR3]
MSASSLSMGLLVDVHAHLDSEKFKTDLDEVMERARNAGLKHIVSNGLDAKSNRRVLELAGKYGEIKAALGIYPIEALKLRDDEIDAEIGFIRQNKGKIIGIGEVGVDYHWDKTPEGHARQKGIFSKFISLAREIDVPLIVHSRDAEADTVDILEHEGCKKVVMHCFGGSMELVERIEKNRWVLSIPANVVVSGHFQKIVKKVSITQLLTETDAPYLGPERGKRNEPANVSGAVKKIAELKGMTEEETAKNIYMNYQKSFG